MHSFPVTIVIMFCQYTSDPALFRYNHHTICFTASGYRSSMQLRISKHSWIQTERWKKVSVHQIMILRCTYLIIFVLKNQIKPCGQQLQVTAPKHIVRKTQLVFWHQQSQCTQHLVSCAIEPGNQQGLLVLLANLTDIEKIKQEDMSIAKMWTGVER